MPSGLKVTVPPGFQDRSTLPDVESQNVTPVDPLAARKRPSGLKDRREDTPGAGKDWSCRWVAVSRTSTAYVPAPPGSL